MSGRLLATSRRAIRTGSWLALRAVIEPYALKYRIAAAFAAVVLALPLSQDVDARSRPARHYRVSAVEFPHHPPRPWPLEFPNAQYLPLAWADVDGWADDDQLAAFKTFRISCQPIMAERGDPAQPKTLGVSLREPCRAARAAEPKTSAEARAFFEKHFVPLQISKLGESDGFAFCRALPELAGVVAIPNAVFYDHRDEGAPFVRFAFCKRAEVLADAAERLHKAFAR